MLAAFMRLHKIDTHIIDAEAEAFSVDQTICAVDSIQPDFAVIVVSGSNPSASTMQMTGVTPLVTALKETLPDICTVVYGLHPSALPEETLQETKSDYICVGEGFDVLLSLFTTKRNKLETRKVLKTQQLVNLDALPMPAWDLIDLNKYRAHNWQCFGNMQNRQPYGVIYTSLGCPFKCEFCVIHTMFCNKHVIRTRNPLLVVDELEYLVNLGVTTIRIIDEMFTLNHQHVERFCELVTQRFGNTLSLWAYGRVGTLTHDLLNKMRNAGIRWLGVGFESGSQRILDVSTKSIKLTQISDTVKMLRDCGIYINANWIFGLPEDDQYSMRSTLDLAKEVNSEWANLYTCMAFPGSPLFSKAQTYPWYVKRTKWTEYSQYSYDSHPLGTEFLTPQEILTFRDDAFNEYYTSTNYLELIRNEFGDETATYLKNMTTVSLKRKLCEV
jgi:radical SAM superfamily enzyme YgiQ (UPF0313 family)